MARGSLTISTSDLARSSAGSVAPLPNPVFPEEVNNPIVQPSTTLTAPTDMFGISEPIQDDSAERTRAIRNIEREEQRRINAGTTRVNVSNIRPNPLNKYASYNSLFTLSCLTVEQQNTAVFRSENISNIVVSSKGDWNNGGVRRVGTTFGNFDFFIDDVIIATIPTLNERTGNTIATKITFQITEPYSMGLFLLTLQEGAIAGGYQNYREAAYLLTIEWAGYNDAGVPSIDPSLSRFYPIKFIDVTMKVTNSGTMYECEAIPYNQIALRDQVTQIKTDIKISGSTVNELLRGAPPAVFAGETAEPTDTRPQGGSSKSLLNAIRTFQLNQISQGIISPPEDEYRITFPRDFSDPEDAGNAISNSKLFVDLTDNGTVPFPDGNTVFDEVKKIYQTRRIQVSEKKNFDFTRGTKIEDIITDIVIRSDYIAKQLTSSDILTDPNGMIQWFRIETRIDDKREYNASYGRQARIYTYRVVPYAVHVNRFLSTNTVPSGYSGLRSTVHRIYDYFYTGRNTEVLNINLDFQMAFFVPVPSDATRNVGQNAANHGIANPPRLPNNSIESGSNPNIQRTTGAGNTAETTFRPGGQVTGATDNPRTQQIKHLQNILQNPGDLVSIEIEIMGDPYYIPSSGMGNQIVDPENFNLLRDGSINYQSGEVDILIRFRTPIDLDPVTGLYKFARTIDQFSGLFMLLEIESKFNAGKFTQVLKCIRRRAQLGPSSPDGSNPQELVFRATE